MKFRIIHTTHFDYEKPAHDSQNEIRLRPWDGATQRCLEFDLSLDRPAAVAGYLDFFGNHAHAISVSAPHESLTIVARSAIEQSPPLIQSHLEVPFSLFLSEDEARAREFYEYLNPSRYVPFSERLRKFFWMAARPGGSEDVAVYVMRVVAFVRDQFEYETAKTNVHSSLNDILKSGGGVCQDFAHLTIGMLRLAGVPARYVSGYMAPPPGRAPENAGQQASHAWLEAWLPGSGWSGFDPTHRCRVDERHIGIAVGRDYGDVPPIRGVYRGSGGYSVMKVDLNVESAEEPAVAAQHQSQQ
jgi:transglutaminase-like putative cysteine protease